LLLIPLATRSALAIEDGISIPYKIDLNAEEPEVTEVCWLDILVEGRSSPQRIDIALYGKVVPETAKNFAALCRSDSGGYKGSSIFRIISNFSIQGGNIGQPTNEIPSKIGRYGKSASGSSFPAENYSIGHDYKLAGVVSMMKDLTQGGLQDSR
jgi:hypothetical protein